MKVLGALRKFDDVVFRFECLLIVVLMAAMALAVFGDTMHRTFNGIEGVPFLLLLVTFVVCYAALTTAELPTPFTRPQALARAAGLTAAIAAGIWLLLTLLPNGLIWSQRMALCFMLWVGFVGASIATREHAHIVFEVADRIWPVKVQPVVKTIAKLVPFLFCLYLALLAFTHTRYHYGDWVESEGVAGVFEGWPAPKFLVYGFLMFPFTVMAYRFLLHGVGNAEITADMLKVKGTEGPGAPEEAGR